MIVCICHGVSDRELKSLVADGATNLREIAQGCRAGTDCGSCLRDIRELLVKKRGKNHRAAVSG